MNGVIDPRGVPAALRYAAVGMGALLFAVAVGFGLNMGWATGLWPWADGKLSYLFVGSILAAVSVAFVWLGMVGEWGALAAGAAQAVVMTAGMAVYMWQLAGRLGREGFVWYAVGLGLATLVSIGVFFWSKQFAILDRRPMPVFLRVSYVILVVALLLTGAALILQAPAIFPWPLNPDSSVMFGWIFVGDAFYFLYSLLNPRWHNARMQLLSFLAYALFLIVPFVGLLGSVKEGHIPSLGAYLAVLLYGGALAVYYLFLDRRTRGWPIEE